MRSIHQLCLSVCLSETFTFISLLPTVCSTQRKASTVGLQRLFLFWSNININIFRAVGQIDVTCNVEVKGPQTVNKLSLVISVEVTVLK